MEHVPRPRDDPKLRAVELLRQADRVVVGIYDAIGVAGHHDRRAANVGVMLPERGCRRDHSHTLLRHGTDLLRPWDEALGKKVLKAIRAKAKGQEGRYGPTVFPHCEMPASIFVPTPGEGGDGKAVERQPVLA